MFRSIPGTKPLFIALAVATLTACGGGGSSGTPDTGTDVRSAAPEVKTGQFLDSAVEGLRYETPTQRGFTNQYGSFSYVPGESVKFYLGSTFLGEVLAQAELTPLDLMTASDDPDKLQNLLRTLQTLDADGDPSNGITINPTSQEYLNQFVLPLNNPAFVFEASNVVNDMIAAVTNGSNLKDAVDSFLHFRETMLASRRNSNETPILNLLNTTWDVKMTSSACEGMENNQLVYRFNALGVVSSGYHRLDTDTCKKAGNGVVFNTYETDILFACANECLDSDLNRVIVEHGEHGDIVTTLNYDTSRQQISIRTTAFDGDENITNTRILTRRQ